MREGYSRRRVLATLAVWSFAGVSAARGRRVPAPALERIARDVLPKGAERHRRLLVDALQPRAAVPAVVERVERRATIAFDANPFAATRDVYRRLNAEDFRADRFLVVNGHVLSHTELALLHVDRASA